ncbi:unnamed protein product [Paramecium pentaurelia]|uniref:Uncharacterized protein n=1 Tax=Paramecium pentaurelia TaxID=43138 RepID=A0A8S1YPL9_9CILI|nr:unnamed protein product [Paramecium pentaurelia]
MSNNSPKANGNADALAHFSRSQEFKITQKIEEALLIMPQIFVLNLPKPTLQEVNYMRISNYMIWHWKMQITAYIQNLIIMLNVIKGQKFIGEKKFLTHHYKIVRGVLRLIQTLQCVRVEWALFEQFEIKRKWVLLQQQSYRK